MSELALPGMEAGKRTETTEWGLRTTAGTIFHRRGHVEPRASEEDAREVAGHAEWGWGDTEVVSRTVVTYTTSWEPQP